MVNDTHTRRRRSNGRYYLTYLLNVKLCILKIWISIISTSWTSKNYKCLANKRIWAWYPTIEVLINYQYLRQPLWFPESRLTVFSAHRNVIKIPSQKNGRHFLDELLLGGEIRHIKATSQYQAHSNKVPACISNIV